MTNTTGSCGPVIKAKGSACILPIKAFTVGEALTSGQWRCYNGGMYVVCKDFDGKLNYPDSKYFKGPYGLEDVLNGAIQPCAGDMLCLCPPIWGACNTDGSVCVPAYGLRACAWDYDPVLKEYRLYTSLKADNHIKPYEGSIANPKTWDGGYDVCGYLNRPVAKDLDGKLYYPGDKDTVFCGVQCAAVDNPDFTYVGGKLRVNFPCHPLRYGTGYREHCDGRVEMWGRAIVGVGSEDRAVAAKLPVLLNGPITYGNTHISITDVGWAANPGQHLDDLPGDYPYDPSTDKLDQTDMGWGPSNANPTGEFVIWAYQHEQSGSAAIELVSWHLVTERGIA